jgi:hypothetical protein
VYTLRFQVILKNIALAPVVVAQSKIRMMLVGLQM